MKDIVEELTEKIIDENYQITKEEALALYDYPDSKKLFAAADKIRKICAGNKSDVCSIINAKRGGCSENCRYCAQSAWWKTDCEVQKMIEVDEAVRQTKSAFENNVKRISLVTAGRNLKGNDFETGIKCFEKMKEATDGQMKFCASFGILSDEELARLKKCGVVRYHHNLESGKKFYSNICTTHSYEERVATILAAKKNGLEICSGGIIGLGESRRDRIDMAFELRNLDVQSVPVNVLTPIKGTPMENVEPLSADEIERTIAVFRFIMPKQVIRCAAGRRNLGKNGRAAFLAGSNALITGDFLTVQGSGVDEDLKMLKELGYEING